MIGNATATMRLTARARDRFRHEAAHTSQTIAAAGRSQTTAPIGRGLPDGSMVPHPVTTSTSVSAPSVVAPHTALCCVAVRRGARRASARITRMPHPADARMPTSIASVPSRLVYRDPVTAKVIDSSDVMMAATASARAARRRPTRPACESTAEAVALLRSRCPGQTRATITTAAAETRNVVIGDMSMTAARGSDSAAPMMLVPTIRPRIPRRRASRSLTATTTAHAAAVDPSAMKAGNRAEKRERGSPVSASSNPTLQDVKASAAPVVAIMEMPSATSVRIGSR